MLWYFFSKIVGIRMQRTRMSSSLRGWKLPVYTGFSLSRVNRLTWMTEKARRIYPIRSITRQLPIVCIESKVTFYRSNCVSPLFPFWNQAKVDEYNPVDQRLCWSSVLQLEECVIHSCCLANQANQTDGLPRNLRKQQCYFCWFVFFLFHLHFQLFGQKTRQTEEYLLILTQIYWNV